MSAGAPALNGKNDGRHSMVLAGTAGGTFAVVLAALLARPEMAFDLARSFGPWFVGAVLGMTFLDRRISEGVRVMRDNTAAQQKLADAVQQIAEKDDRQTDLMQREIRYVGQQMDKLMERFDDFQKATERARGAQG